MLLKQPSPLLSLESNIIIKHFIADLDSSGFCPESHNGTMVKKKIKKNIILEVCLQDFEE